MTVDSHFNRAALRRDLWATVFGVAAFFWTFVHGDRFSLRVTAAIMSGVVLVAVLYWLARLKRISIWSDGFEVTPLLFPFLRRQYRFAEFDCMIAGGEGETPDRLTLIRDCQAELVIRSKYYDNIGALRSALHIPERHGVEVDASREVRSRFVWWLPFVLLGSVALACLGIALPLASYLEDGVADGVEWAIGGALFLMFFVLTVYMLSALQRIVVWQGRIEVQTLLWPFRKRLYRLSDFDGVYYVTQQSENSAAGATEARWLMRGGRLALCISADTYANYEELKSATRTEYLGSMRVGALEMLRARLGKTYHQRPVSSLAYETV